MEVNMGASTSHFDELDGMSEIGDEVDEKKVDMNAMMEIYRCFEFNRPYVKLPILATREEILLAIEENPVVIIQGDTGCGKTTQIPQYILDEACQQQKYCNIVVTQPRKIAAISNSKRVAAERHCQIGSLVGYQVSAARTSS
jgi:ATP-dependent RNA helicase TDRD9